MVVNHPRAIHKTVPVRPESESSITGHVRIGRLTQLVRGHDNYYYPRTFRCRALVRAKYARAIIIRFTWRARGLFYVRSFRLSAAIIKKESYRRKKKITTAFQSLAGTSSNIIIIIFVDSTKSQNTSAYTRINNARYNNNDNNKARAHASIDTYNVRHYVLRFVIIFRVKKTRARAYGRIVFIVEDGPCSNRNFSV